VVHGEFAPATLPRTGNKETIWREGDQIVWQRWSENVLKGALDVYPESETDSFLKIDGT